MPSSAAHVLQDLPCLLKSTSNRRAAELSSCLDFCCCVSDALQELHKREAEQQIDADWEIDAFMTADAVQGKKEAIVSEYILRILGLEVGTSTVYLLDAHHSSWLASMLATAPPNTIMMPGIDVPEGHSNI